MKNRMLYKLFRAIVLSSLMLPLLVVAQTDSTKTDSAKASTRESIIYLQYHAKNNTLPFLKIQTKNKTDQGFTTAVNVPVTVYLDTDLSKDAMVGQVATDNTGAAILGIPTSLASPWKSKSTHTFYAHTDASPAFDAATKEVSVTIARLRLDTVRTDESKSVVATLEKNEGGTWVPVPEVDVKLAVRRFGGNVNIGDEETYATDSSGNAAGEFLLSSLPGDKQGTLELVASVDDNDEVGTLESSMMVPWGTIYEYKSDFGKRSLWATPRRAPLWLIVMAYGCIIAVWSVIIYLITRIIQIKRLGKKAAN